MKKKHLVILTGAGISAESGLKTFRDSDGLWNGYNVMDVATPEAFETDPEMVLEFYNMRRRDVAAAAPNEAHKGIASLEHNYDVTVITQNIDDLHERGGSKNVVHLHGEIFKKRPSGSMLVQEITSCEGDILLGDCDEKGRQYRPHIVWFHEPVPMMEKAAAICNTADIFVVIGTSLQVYPAASLIHYIPANIPCYIIDKVIPATNLHGFTRIEKPATEGVKELVDLLN